MSSVHLIVKAAGGAVKKLLFDVLYYIGDVGEVLSIAIRGPEGRVPLGGAPAALVGDWGEGKGGGGSVQIDIVV